MRQDEYTKHTKRRLKGHVMETKGTQKGYVEEVITRI